MRQIVITFNNDRGYAVTESGRTVDRLAWDEMLGQVAQLTHPQLGKPRYTMLTPEEYHAQEDKYKTSAEQRLHFDERGIPA
ncbi:hypothetical protein [Ralstonia holmesii]|uniref:hypothetical protein n=1 Tax=Ralstonia holmesii TaxID=3058602 RepID=UPI003D64ADA6